MAARKWTDAQRAAQSAAIHTWQPWQHSTGAKSAEGKVVGHVTLIEGVRGLFAGLYAGFIGQSNTRKH